MSQRICVLGGGGDVGAAIGAELKSSAVTPVLADIRETACRTAGAQIDAETDQIDVTDPQAADQLAAMDVAGVVSAVGPFNELGEDAALRAIEAGIPFVDICDDYQTTNRILSLDSQAKRAGVPVVVGCGWTPGLSSLLASVLIEVHGSSQITIDWVGSAADATGKAAIAHLIGTVAGKAPVVRNGTLTEQPAGIKRRLVNLPELGAATTVRCGHPEPITLSREYSPDLVAVNAGVLPPWQTRLLVWLGRLGITTGQRRRQMITQLLGAGESLFAAAAPSHSGMIVTSEHARVGVIGQMRTLTARPAAQGIIELIRSQPEPGVYSPEAIFDPVSFVASISDDSVRSYHHTDGAWRRKESLSNTHE